MTAQNLETIKVDKEEKNFGLSLSFRGRLHSNRLLHIIIADLCPTLLTTHPPLTSGEALASFLFSLK